MSGRHASGAPSGPFGKLGSSGQESRAGRCVMGRPGTVRLMGRVLGAAPSAVVPTALGHVTPDTVARLLAAQAGAGTRADGELLARFTRSLPNLEDFLDGLAADESERPTGDDYRLAYAREPSAHPTVHGSFDRADDLAAEEAIRRREANRDAVAGWINHAFRERRQSRRVPTATRRGTARRTRPRVRMHRCRARARAPGRPRPDDDPPARRRVSSAAVAPASHGSSRA